MTWDLRDLERGAWRGGLPNILASGNGYSSARTAVMYTQTAPRACDYALRSSIILYNIKGRGTCYSRTPNPRACAAYFASMRSAPVHFRAAGAFHGTASAGARVIAIRAASYERTLSMNTLCNRLPHVFESSSRLYTFSLYTCTFNYYPPGRKILPIEP